MNMVDIAAALLARLALVSPALDVVPENTPYTPVAGRAFMATNLLAADPLNPVMGGAFHRDRGLFQVALRFPAGAGAGAALAHAERLRDAFTRGTTLAAGDGFVLVTGTPSIGPSHVDADRFTLPLRVAWQADAFS